MAVTAQHEEYTENLPIWERCRDASGGEDEIKEDGTAYLPKLGNGQTEDDYRSYLARAVYFNATGRTVDGLTGLIFRKPPIMKYPASMDSIMRDVTMTGLSSMQFAEQIVDEVVTVGRVGVLVDYPTTDGSVLTRAQQEQMGMHPYANIYRAEQIINWRETRVNNSMQITHIVLREEIDEPSADDQFSMDEVAQYRALDVVDGVYMQQVYRYQKGTDGLDAWLPYGEPIIPQMNGASMDWIPFIFIGPRDTSSCVQKPPILDLVNLNIAHYRNSADYEFGLHMTGTPTLFVIGALLNEDDGIRLGSTTANLLTMGSDAKFVQATAAELSGLKTALDDKEDNMAVLGARILATEKRVPETAETAQIHRAGENSVLADIANVVSEALTTIFAWIAEWSMIANADITVELNTDYLPNLMTGPEIVAVVQAWQSGAISQRVLFWNLQQGERVPEDMTYEDMQAQIDQEGPALGALDVTSANVKETVRTI